eukprot:TRINITY_DN9423_c0_g1_i3.p1 TRINITY_DN9423_c0_g1~~TRINITY_DN9423_c0_g1_i3.p1  ORF type:complete len:137 (+),score=24.32 TRINITY_DN9423_c0_g1_i3:25-435(+)
MIYVLRYQYSLLYYFKRLVSNSILIIFFFFFFQAEDGIRDAQESRGLGDVYKRQVWLERTAWYKARTAWFALKAAWICGANCAPICRPHSWCPAMVSSQLTEIEPIDGRLADASSTIAVQITNSCELLIAVAIIQQ